MSPLITLANLYISMRKDLGFTESELTPDDFLKILITDWDQAKLKNLQEN
ncbi:hypothetical protein J2Q11_11490 [Tenacibaculum finnmarkense genomovar finnmarkense]|nr:hypothetical protein [Tenacibaculum finnmarkense]MCD8418318.1 hypothetical protein [Tenacibaculum finnmarkense genomovar finnmarkense]MCG8186649.1 hypothetical protein [Tenacibaculum finnmarkense genomovar finnmarkense]MCG8203183.1 hypothetical protein [Tenacibaculum finnmarkense genomovar finnmarkense]MCG8210556.1 hypothetical protein [Tenacibaculum finnmarkense genomovar finnmarkense]MCG8213417.1 hypothetical protein [Tenacibaculum finnmarkense genomovar finnmarkense]